MTLSQRAASLVALIALLIAGAVYFLTLTPTVPFWDSGEFIAVSYILGVPHPPGTPFFVLIGRVATLLPLGNVAQRVNGLSAVSAALCVLLTYLSTLRLIRKAQGTERQPWHEGVAIVAALASNVELLILDEPTSGLDPLMERVFQEVIGEAKANGASVLLSSHIMAEVESLADRLSIIRDGRIVQEGTLAELRGQTRTTIHAELSVVPPDEVLVGLHDVHVDGSRLRATVDSLRIGEAMAALTPLGITSLTVEPPSLESLFLRLYDEDAADPGTGR